MKRIVLPGDLPLMRHHGRSRRQVFRVDVKTVIRWANEGKLPSVRTPGNHRRFWRPSTVEAMLNGEAVQ